MFIWNKISFEIIKIFLREITRNFYLKCLLKNLLEENIILNIMQ